MTEERLAELMVMVTDRTASPADQEELMDYLIDRPELRQELEAHQAVKALTDGWVERLEADLAIDRSNKDPATSSLLAIGTVIFALSMALFTGWGLVAGMLDAEAPMVVRVGLGGMAASFVLLLFGGMRWRMITASNVPYREVIR